MAGCCALLLPHCHVSSYDKLHCFSVQNETKCVIYLYTEFCCLWPFVGFMIVHVYVIILFRWRMVYFYGNCGICEANRYRCSCILLLNQHKFNLIGIPVLNMKTAGNKFEKESDWKACQLETGIRGRRIQIYALKRIKQDVNPSTNTNFIKNLYQGICLYL